MRKIGKKGKLAYLGGVVTPLLLLTAQGAQAWDLKTYSGSTCQAFYGSQESRFNKQWDGIKNISGAASWVMCGIIRDKYVETQGSQGFQTYVKAPASATTLCYHSERTYSGGVEVDTQVASRTGSGNLYLDTSSSQNSGNRVLACKLPPNGVLSSIWYYEWDSTDNNN